MSDTPQLPPLLARSHHKFVAFSAVGVAMVCVPLMQVLQVQQADLQQLQSSRALLDPVAAAVHTQYGLLAHRGLASQVLQGMADHQGPRAAAAQEVDIRLGTLSTVLTDGGWGFALAEARTLGDDWRHLAQQVAAQRISASQSDDAHRLRVEQTLQVVDLVALTQAPGDRPAQASQQAWLASTRLLARLASDIADAQSASKTTFDPALATLPSALPSALRQPEVAQALEQAQGRAAELAKALSRPDIDAAQPGGVTSVAAAKRAALKSQQHLFHALHQAQDQALVAQTSAVTQQRQWLLSGLAALAALATALGMALWRALRRDGLRLAVRDRGDGFEQAGFTSASHDDAAATAAPKHRDETGRLLRRLRENVTPAETRRASRLDHEDSLPPPR